MPNVIETLPIDQYVHDPDLVRTAGLFRMHLERATTGDGYRAWRLTQDMPGTDDMYDDKRVLVVGTSPRDIECYLRGVYDGFHAKTRLLENRS